MLRQSAKELIGQLMQNCMFTGIKPERNYRKSLPPRCALSLAHPQVGDPEIDEPIRFQFGSPENLHIGAFPSKITAAVASAVPVLFVGQGEGASTVESLNIGKAFDFQKLFELEKYLEHYINNREEECEAFQAHIIHAQNHAFNVEANNNSLNQFVLNL